MALALDAGSSDNVAVVVCDIVDPSFDDVAAPAQTEFYGAAPAQTELYVAATRRGWSRAERLLSLRRTRARP